MAGGSGYTAAFTHPDPIDPNDRKRQQTQARAGDYPYDMPVMYGAPVGTDNGGAAYQRPGSDAPPVPRNKKASSVQPMSVWNQLEAAVADDDEEQYGGEVLGNSRSSFVHYINSRFPRALNSAPFRLGDDLKWTADDGELYVQVPSQKKSIFKRAGTEDYVWDGHEWFILDEGLSSPETNNYEPGPQAPDSAPLGYGNHGCMGEDGMDPLDLDMDALRQEFRDSFIETLPHAQNLGRKGLFALLVQLDPEYSAELFAPDDDSEMMDMYADWGQRVYAPGAEEDPE